MIIDKTGAKLYRSTFGGDYRMIETMKKKGQTLENLFIGQGGNVQYKWKDIKDLLDIEDYNGKNY